MSSFSLHQRQILWRATIKEKRLLPHLSVNDSMLDIGSGNGGLVYLLRHKDKMPITPLDVVDKSRFADVNPITYNGKHLPFPDNSFDVVSLITVLHHTENPELILKEAIRVSANKVVVMEDVFNSYLQKQLTSLMDSLVNWEFRSHPHSNKRDNEWRTLFTKLGLELKQVEYYKLGLFFKQVLYILKKKKGRSI